MRVNVAPLPGDVVSDLFRPHVRQRRAVLQTWAGPGGAQGVAVDLNILTRTVSGPVRSGSAGEATAVVDLAGQIDLETAPLLRARLGELLDAGHHHLVLDFDQVSFLDSTALSTLVATAQRAHARGGTLHLVCTVPRLVKIFRATGLTRTLPLHPDLDAALAALPAPEAY